MLTLRFYRLKRGLSQSALAHLTHTSQAAISLIELRLMQPDDDLLANLAFVLGVSPAFVLLKPVVVEGELAEHAERSA